MTEHTTNSIVDLAAWAGRKKQQRPTDYATLPSTEDMLSASVNTLTDAGYAVTLEFLPHNDHLPVVTLRSPEGVDIPLAGLIQSICMDRDTRIVQSFAP